VSTSDRCLAAIDLDLTLEYDQLVVAYTSGIQSGMTNVVVQNYCAIDFSEHIEIAADPVAAGLVLNTLDPPHISPCRVA